MKKRNSKSEARFVWADRLILLVLITGSLLLAFLYYNRKQAALPTVEISYTLCLSAVSESFAEANGNFTALIPSGAVVTNDNNTTVLGKVLFVETVPHTVAVAGEDSVLFVEMPTQVDLYITVQASATEREGDGLRVSDIRIAAGDKGNFRVGSFYAVGAQIVSVSLAKEKTG